MLISYKFTKVVLLPVGCPINNSNKLLVQRQTDRQTDGRTDGRTNPGCTRTIDLRAPKDMNTNFYVILRNIKFAVQIKHLEINCVISEEDKKKKSKGSFNIQE